MFVLLFCYIMKDGDVMNKKSIIGLSVGLSALAIIGVSVLATYDMVKHDMSWSHDIPFETGVYEGNDVKEANNKEHIYSAFRLEVELISVDDYITSNDMNTVAYYREHEDNRTTAEYYSMNFYVQNVGVLSLEHLDIYNLYFYQAARDAYFIGTIGRDEFKVYVDKQGLNKITFGDYSADIVYRSRG